MELLLPTRIIAAEGAGLGGPLSAHLHCYEILMD
jgi:hypothetical protein